jgi:hypothetical protein
LVDLSEDSSVFCIFHGFTLLLSAFKFGFQFFLLILTVALQLSLLFGKFDFLVNHGRDHSDLMLFDRTILYLLIELSLLLLDLVDLSLVLQVGIS